MRKTIEMKLEDIADKKAAKDEIEHAKQYVGKYTLKTMSFGKKNEAQFRAVTVNPNSPQESEVDTWKFRFLSLLSSIEEAPGFGKGYGSVKAKELEKYIYDSPPAVGELLQDIADEVNEYLEKDRKN